MAKIGFDLIKGKTNFVRPCAKLKINISKWNFGIGILLQFGISSQEPVFFLQKSLHPTLILPARSGGQAHSAADMKKYTVYCWNIPVYCWNIPVYCWKSQYFIFKDMLNFSQFMKKVFFFLRDSWFFFFFLYRDRKSGADINVFLFN